MLFAVLAFASVMLTYTMFHARNSMLGFPAAIMWAIMGGYAYNESTVTWDIYYIFGFACILGMTVFCMLGAYGLKNKKEQREEDNDWLDSGRMVDEKKNMEINYQPPKEPVEPKVGSALVQRVRARAEQRRNKWKSH